MWLLALGERQQLDRDLAGVALLRRLSPFPPMNNNLEPVAGKATATIKAMAPALKLNQLERVKLAEMLRTRKVPTDRNGAVSLDVLVSLVREMRGES